MATEDLEWERSKISNQDMNLLKRLGFTKKKDSLRFPHEESYPKPPIEYRVSFVDHLIRGLSPPIHEFLRGLLFVYGLQLHQLTPNSILHMSIFITLCECFLGVQPNWALWKRIFCLRRNGSHGVAYNIGGVIICVRSDVDYFDIKFPDSVQGWRKRWLYVHEEDSDSMEYNIAPFDGKAKILRRRSWDAEASEEEKLATEALMTRSRVPVGRSYRKSATSLEKENETEVSSSTRSSLPAASPKGKRKRNDVEDSGTSKPEEAVPSRQKAAYDPYLETLISSKTEVNERANTLAKKLEQSEEARKKAESDAVQARREADKAKTDAAGVEDLRKRLHDAENSLSEHIAAQSAHVGQIVPKCLAKMSKRKKNFGKYDDIVTPVAEDMMDDLLRMDAEFFMKGSYAEHSTRAINNERLTIDNILGNP
ncbi:hypothetical protein QYE76_006851 [Lolium multiflorum]|uniref:Transposase (putative) gypsy type domain-containing protein n=1 Tax=Lolium multiflorum TaxID=4521 RepID=A0AAD8W4R9_LOLMU|nr:hypothetical protein QYE76_006851 [Lolium multiflorum]